MALIANIEKVERSLFHAMRLLLVSEGYLPDITNTGLYPDNDTGVAAFKAALAAIKAGSKGFAIEIFGVGSNQKKYSVAIPRIVILEEQRLPGSLGGGPIIGYDPIVNSNSVVSYDVATLPPQTKDFTYKISLVYQTAEQGRIMSQILALALPARGYVKIWQTSTNEKIFVRQSGFSETSFTEEGYREAGYMYTVEDVWDIDQVALPSVSPILYIDVYMYDQITGQPINESGVFIKLN